MASRPGADWQEKWAERSLALQLDALFAEHVMGWKKTKLPAPTDFGPAATHHWTSPGGGQTWYDEPWLGLKGKSGDGVPPFSRDLTIAWRETTFAFPTWTLALCQPHKPNATITAVLTNAIGTRGYPPTEILFRLGQERDISISIEQKFPYAPADLWVAGVARHPAEAVVRAALAARGVPVPPEGP